MRIISNFKDYYDGVAKQGIDTEIVYAREIYEESYEKLNEQVFSYASIFFDVKGLNSLRYSEKAELHYLGFCGKIYPFIKLFSHSITVNSENKRESSIVLKKIFWSAESFIEYAKEHFTCFEKSTYRFWSKTDDLGSESDIKQAFKEIKNESMMKELFFSFNSPIFLITPGNRSHKITINPILKELEFFKVKDSYSAFQDLSMYVSGVLNQSDNAMIKISDADKIHKHGFDKWSFRKLPSKKD